MSTTDSQSHTPEVVDGVQRYPRTGIKVVITGASVAGLTSALECWRKGHEVVVLERNDEFSQLGDWYAIQPNALSTLSCYPSAHAAYQAYAREGTLALHAHTGDQIWSHAPTWDDTDHAAKGTRIALFNSRRTFVGILYAQAQRLGIPVMWGRKVASYEEDVLSGEGRVRTEAGDVFSGDVVLAADGVGTRSYDIIRGEPLRPKPSGYACARASVRTADIPADSPAAALVPSASDTPPKVKFYMAPDMHLVLFLGEETTGYNFTHRDTTGTAQESWNAAMKPEAVLDMLKSAPGGTWPAAILDFVARIPTIVDWKLTWRNPQPHWTSPGGRVLQVGDAAHTFMPTSGSGATQAMEDGISVAECLRIAGVREAAWATRVHEVLRQQRVSLVQRVGFVNRNVLHHFDPTNPGGSIKGLFTFGSWITSHKADVYARERYVDALAHVQSEAPFENTNLPPGHKFRNWSVEDELRREEAGEVEDLQQNGDWK